MPYNSFGFKTLHDRQLKSNGSLVSIGIGYPVQRWCRNDSKKSTRCQLVLVLNQKKPHGTL
jgi:hypothetical protein